MSGRYIYCPSPEFLNLSFGVVVSLAINVLSTIALADEQVPSTTILSVVALSLSALATGGLALLSSKIRDDAVLALGLTLSDAERRAEIRELTRARSFPIITLEVSTAVCLLVGSILLFWR